MRIHLDTHVALWLAAGEKRRLKPASLRLRRGPLFLSPIVIVEMEILREIGQIRAPVLGIMDILSRDHGIEEAEGDIREIGHRAGNWGGREIRSIASSWRTPSLIERFSVGAVLIVTFRERRRARSRRQFRDHCCVQRSARGSCFIQKLRARESKS